MFEKLKKLLTLFFKGNSLDYICGTEALPLPFSQEEESDKITRLERGDEKAKAALVEHNLRLVVSAPRLASLTFVAVHFQHSLPHMLPRRAIIPDAFPAIAN